MGLLNNDLGKKIYILPQDNIVTTDGAPEQVTNPSDIIILSATENFDKTESATLTQYPVSTGATVGDHYRFDGTTINFSGIITDTPTSTAQAIVGLIEGSSNVIPYIKRLRRLVRTSNGSSPLVTIYLPDGNGESNCVITSLRINRDASVSNGYKVDISARKLLLATTSFKIVTSSEEYDPKTTLGQDTGSTVPKQIPDDIGDVF